MIHKISNEVLEISVKSFGAELCSLKTLKDDKEHLWQGDKRVWGKHAPILFPVIGCLKNGSYTYEGKVYQMTKHGFARDRVFDLIESTSETLVYRLISDEESLKMYPFEFELLVTYTLKNKGLEVVYTVKNLDSKTMYFSIGGHPAFNCPMDKGHYALEFETEETLETRLVNLENGLMKQETEGILKGDRRLNLTYDLFAKDALVFENYKSKAVSIANKETDERLTMTIEGFPYLGIWSPPGPFVCIEPWYGMADYVDTCGRLEEKVGIQRLAANEMFECFYSILIE